MEILLKQAGADEFFTITECHYTWSEMVNNQPTESISTSASVYTCLLLQSHSVFIEPFTSIRQCVLNVFKGCKLKLLESLVFNLTNIHNTSLEKSLTLHLEDICWKVKKIKSQEFNFGYFLFLAIYKFNIN